MEDQDTERLKRGKPLIEQEELMLMAREAESGVLRLEAEYRVARMTPKPKAGASKPDSPHSPIQVRLKTLPELLIVSEQESQSTWMLRSVTLVIKWGILLNSALPKQTGARKVV